MKNDLSIRARDLRPGMKVPLPNGDLALITSVSLMDGTNGLGPQLISVSTEGKDKTAVALLIEFSGHERLMAHPNSVVMKR